MTLKEKIYNIIICALSIISVVFAIIDFANELTYCQLIIDRVIYIVFVSDYVIRFCISKYKNLFFKSNIFDLIAIIPFNSAFRIFRILKFVKVLKLTKLLKFTKLLKIGAVSSRSIGKFKRFFNTNGFKYVLYLTTAAITLSSFSMMYFENMSFQDSLWWSFVTATTVEYGDLSPTTAIGRIIAALLMLVGIGLLGSLTSTITTFFLSTREKKDIDNSKIEMCLLLYANLNDEEKAYFKDRITK